MRFYYFALPVDHFYHHPACHHHVSFVQDPLFNHHEYLTESSSYATTVSRTFSLSILFYLTTAEDTTLSCISSAGKSFSTRLLHNWHCMDSCTNDTALKGKLLLIYLSTWNFRLLIVVSTVFYRLSEMLRCHCRQRMDPWKCFIVQSTQAANGPSNDMLPLTHFWWDFSHCMHSWGIPQVPSLL